MPKRGKGGFALFLFSALKNSMLTGIPQIVAAGNWPKKFIRTVVFIFCLIGFIYQSFIFMKMYWEYKTVVDIRVYKPDKVDRPSATICMDNGLYTTRVCEDSETAAFGIYCEKLQEGMSGIENFCECAPRYCKNGVVKDNLWRIPMSYLKRINMMPYEKRRKYNVKLEEIIKSCTEFGMNEEHEKSQCKFDYYREIPCYFDVLSVETCYTFNTLIERPNYTLPKVSSEGEILLELDHLESQADFEQARTQIRLSLHNAYRMTSPYDDGYILYSNYLYKFRFKKVIKRLLPHPYDTDCTDYRQAWKARGGKGPTTQNECTEECELNVMLEMYGCAGFLSNYKGTHQRCILTYYQILPLAPRLIRCKTICKPACLEEDYVLERDVFIQDDESSCGKKNSGIGGISTVKLLLDGMETTVYEYRPKFETIETFSYLGGYVGMWLGISLLALFDFLETVIVMLKYPMKRYLRFQIKRKTKIISMQPSKRNV